MNSRIIILASLIFCFVLGSQTLFAAIGILNNLHPPGNNGTTRGVGVIVTEDGTQYKFQTPQDNNGAVLKVGRTISFDLNESGKISNVNAPKINGNPNVMNKGELIDAMAKDAGLSKADAGKALNAFVRNASRSLKKGENVALVGFGSFSVAKGADSFFDVFFDVDMEAAKELYPLFALNYFSTLNFINSNVIARAVRTCKPDGVDDDCDGIDLKTRFSSQSFFAESFYDIFVNTDMDILRMKGFHDKKKGFAIALNERLQNSVEVFSKSLGHELTHVVQQASGKVMKAAVVALTEGAIEMQNKYLDPDSDNDGLSDEQLKAMIKDSELERDVLLKALHFMGTNITANLKKGKVVRIFGFGDFSVDTQAVKLIVPVAINKGLRAKKVAKFKAGKALADTVK